MLKYFYFYLSTQTQYFIQHCKYIWGPYGPQRPEFRPLDSLAALINRTKSIT